MTLTISTVGSGGMSESLGQVSVEQARRISCGTEARPHLVRGQTRLQELLPKPLAQSGILLGHLQRGDPRGVAAGSAALRRGRQCHTPGPRR